MVNEEIVGTDIDRNWVLNSEGGLQLVKGSDNLSQAIYLRLTAYFNSLWWAYNNYGSYTKDWFGKNQNEYTRETLTDEIHRRVLQDPRIKDAEVELINWTSNSIGIKIRAEVPSSETFQEYFIFSNLPRKNESVNSPDYKNTYIDTKENYYAKHGEMVSIHCYVRDNEMKKVPIGEVSLNIGGYRVEIEDNPQKIAQSGTPDPGGCLFSFRVPKFIKMGSHKLIFTYKGIRGYNNCVGESKLNVVERLPTDMEFVYEKGKNREFYVANNNDILTTPIVHVKDANEYDVLHGEVKYYVSDYEDYGDLILIEFPLIFRNNILLQRTVYMRVKPKILDYTTKFMFEINYMFRPLDIFDLVSKEGELIDTLECEYDNNAFYLTSTTHTKQHNSTFPDEHDVNKDIDTQRLSNCNIIMRVIE